MECKDLASCYRGDKLIGSKLMVCFICHKSEPNLDLIKSIRSKDKQSISLICNHLGLRNLSEKFNFNYIEDKGLKTNSDYLNKSTGTFELWTVCNCELRVHPDCFLQSIKVNFKYKCDVCGEIFKIGYKTIKKDEYSCVRSIVNLILIALALGASIVLLSLQIEGNAIIWCRAFGLILVTFLFTFFAFFISRIGADSQNFMQAYLLPYSHKFDMSFGFRKFRITRSFRVGSASHRNDDKSGVNGIPTDFTCRETQENLIDLDLNCPFYNELLSQIKGKGNVERKITLKVYDFEYQASSNYIISRFIQYIQCTLCIESLDDLIETKIERQIFFNHIVKRNSVLAQTFECLAQESSLSASQLRKINLNSKSNSSFGKVKSNTKQAKNSTDQLVRGSRQSKKKLVKQRNHSEFNLKQQLNRSINNSRVEEIPTLKLNRMQSLVSPIRLKRTSKLNNSLTTDKRNFILTQKGMTLSRFESDFINSYNYLRSPVDERYGQRKVKFHCSNIAPLKKISNEASTLQRNEKLSSLVEQQESIHEDLANNFDFPAFNYNAPKLHKSSSRSQSSSNTSNSNLMFELRSERSKREDSIKLDFIDLDLGKRARSSSEKNINAQFFLFHNHKAENLKLQHLHNELNKPGRDEL